MSMADPIIVKATAFECPNHRVSFTGHIYTATKFQLSNGGKESWHYHSFLDPLARFFHPQDLSSRIFPTTQLNDFTHHWGQQHPIPHLIKASLGWSLSLHLSSSLDKENSAAHHTMNLMAFLFLIVELVTATQG